MKHPLLVLFLIINTLITAQNTNICYLKGTVASNDILSLLLKRIDQDLRFDDILEIRVVNNHFEYQITLEHPEAFELMPGSALENSGGPFIPLFLEPGAIQLSILSESDFQKTTISGSNLNLQYAEYKRQIIECFRPRLQSIQEEIDLLASKKQYLSPEMQQLREELKSTESFKAKDIVYRKMEDLAKKHLDKTDAGRLLDQQTEIIFGERRNFQQDFIEKSQNIVAYYLFLSDLIYDKQNTDVALAKKNFKLLSESNPGSPFNTLASALLNGIANIRVGSSFVDFTAPNLEGKETNLSEIIKGTVTLLNLWATWCGPCISHSRDLLPVYERFKNEPFTVIGVAGEFKNTDRLKAFLTKEKWPWINLVELDRANGIWRKYGVDNAGGATFLIDENGLLLAINPSAQEVHAELEKRFGIRPPVKTP